MSVETFCPRLRVEPISTFCVSCCERAFARRNELSLAHRRSDGCPRRNLLISCGVLAVTTAVAYGGYQLWWHINYYVEEHTDYSDPPINATLELEDDRLADKRPDFDPTLVDSRPLGEWELNASGAVVRLDCPWLKPDRDTEALVLRSSTPRPVRCPRCRLDPIAKCESSRRSGQTIRRWAHGGN